MYNSYYGRLCAAGVPRRPACFQLVHIWLLHAELACTLCLFHLTSSTLAALSLMCFGIRLILVLRLLDVDDAASDDSKLLRLKLRQSGN